MHTRGRACSLSRGREGSLVELYEYGMARAGGREEEVFCAGTLQSILV